MEISLNTLRMYVHVLAAVVWVGGQLVMAGLMPAIRKLGPDAPRAVARQFGRVSWPALLIVTFTGIWNALLVEFADQTEAYKTKFGIKMTCYLVTLFGALLHTLGPTVGRSKPKLRVPMLAIGGLASSLGAAAALFFAVALKY